MPLCFGFFLNCRWLKVSGPLILNCQTNAFENFAIINKTFLPKAFGRLKEIPSSCISWSQCSAAWTSFQRSLFIDQRWIQQQQQQQNCGEDTCSETIAPGDVALVLVLGSDIVYHGLRISSSGVCLMNGICFWRVTKSPRKMCLRLVQDGSSKKEKERNDEVRMMKWMFGF